MTAFYILPAHPATRVTTFENRTRRAHIPVPRGFYPQTSISGIGTIKRLSNESRCLQATLSFMPLYQPHCNRPACPDRSFAIRPVPIIIVRFVMISKLSNQRVTQTNEILRRFVTLPYPGHKFSDLEWPSPIRPIIASAAPVSSAPDSPYLPYPTVVWTTRFGNVRYYKLALRQVTCIGA